MSGPSPAETRVIIQDLINALATISAAPRRGGPASIGPAREIASEALRVMPKRYMPRDDEWVASRTGSASAYDRLMATAERVRDEAFDARLREQGNSEWRDEALR